VSSPPSPAGTAPACRFCRAALGHAVVDLGPSPLANSYLAPADLGRGEVFYPLRVWLCGACWLLQLEEFEAPERIFGHYAYFSSYSTTWLRHAEAYVALATERFGLGPASRVIEVASNDGYLLQYFVARGIPVLGIEPAANVAEAAQARGVPTRVRFFGEAAAAELVAEGVRADLLVANNVFAHVPALNDFTRGLARVLAPRGVLTLELAHLARLLAENQFDTIYHEHFQYYSLITAEQVLAAHGLVVFDVDELPTHGGSLRLYVRHAGDPTRPVGPRVAELRAREEAAGLTRLDTYRDFGGRVREAKRALLEFLIGARREGKSVAAYGAAAKGNTLLNYCGIREDFIDYTVDRSPHKQGRYLPGTRIPIHAPARIEETRPDYVLILPWNLKEEVMEQMACVRDWGGQFIVPIPEVKLL
jgi:SAM-dependent methyltransferase